MGNLSATFDGEKYYVSASGKEAFNGASPFLPVNFAPTRNLTDFKNRVSHKFCRMAFIDSAVDGTSIVELIEIVKRIASHVAIVVKLADASVKDLKYFLVNLEIKYLVIGEVTKEELVQTFSKSLARQREVNISQEKLMRIKSLNQELESLTGNLEDVVKSSVSSLIDSKTKVEKSVVQFRSLVQFVKELSVDLGMQEFVGLLRRELKGFHNIHHFFLGVDEGQGKGGLIYFQGSQLVKTEVSQLWDSVNTIKINSLDDQKYLANQMARPFNHLISVEIEGRQGADRRSHVIYFEHSMSFEEIEQFVSFISFRLQAVSIVLDRILIEGEMLEVSQLWESTFDNISDPVAIIESDFKPMRSNLGFQLNEETSTCYKLFANRDDICPGCPVEKSIRTGMPSVGHIDHSERIFEVHTYPISIGLSGESKVVVNHYVDITLQNELQSKLIQNEKMVAIGHLAGNIAHELNNPLTGIRSMSQVLLTEVPEESQLYRDLIEVETASRRCQDIIVNLLDFSASESKVPVSKWSMAELVEKTLPLLKTITSEHRFEIKLDAETSKVMVEPQLMQQVVFNLINNACQAMKKAGELNIKVYMQNENVILEIKDTGEGISNENLGKVFDPFFTTKKSGEGTGLGLSTCKSIVERFHGKIWVESKTGVGTTFFVSLPKGKE